MKTHAHDNAHAAQRRAVAHQAEHGEAAAQLAQAGPAAVDHHVNHSPRMVAQRQLLGAAFGPVAQREPQGLEEDLPVQGKALALQQPVQREAGLDDEEPAAQAKQARSGSGGTVQAQTEAPAEANLTGMPSQLKSGVEALSGMDMSDVRVHRNSDKPAQLNALAYAQGNDIHLGPGQEQHLPHEAWHVVQQRQGRVQATMQMAGVGVGVGVNDDAGLEEEADVMGERAALQGAMQWRTAEVKRQDLTPDPTITAAFGNSKAPLQARWVDQQGHGLPDDLMTLAQSNPLYAILQAGHRAGFVDEAEELQYRLEGLNDMGYVGPLGQVSAWATAQLEDQQTHSIQWLLSFVLSNLAIPDESMPDEAHEEDSGPGNPEEELEKGDLELSEITGSDQLQIANSLIARYPELFEQFKELSQGEVSDPRVFLDWYNKGVLTRNQFKIFLQKPRQFARTPGTKSYQAGYATTNFGQFKDVTYKRDGYGSIAFQSPTKAKKWTNPMPPGSEVQLTQGSGNKTHGITLSGTKIKVAGASRSQHFSIANRIANNSFGSASPAGWTWHHLTTHYKMVLVDRAVHAKHGHNGGVYVWK